MECAVSQLRSSEPSCGGGSSPSPAAAAWAFLPQEATGDSECDDDLAAATPTVNADDGDAESCSGGEDYSIELDERRLVSWECWMVESASVVVVGGEAACPAPTEGDAAAAGDADSDRLFWEACIAHGY
ncbi:hypothetical protein C2845_PM07G10640 [Panicum miliaceum]|uniref:Uncharacterized protein n=1 Tax=Panicum miliaceum TaxID=4540 RepID=A0A3L6SPA5_PANMI|nr:hypothetical protein C2845_PM07G10640 [Panicum miliaceum]